MSYLNKEPHVDRSDPMAVMISWSYQAFATPIRMIVSYARGESMLLTKRSVLFER